jgi:hypothetical protein
MNNPRNYDAMRAEGIIPEREPNNRHARLYPVCVRALWGILAKWLSPFAPYMMLGHLRLGRTFQVCINPPGHYLAVVAYDTATQEFIGNDSWTTRNRTPMLPARGFNFRLTEAEVQSIVPEAIVYYPPEA